MAIIPTDPANIAPPNTLTPDDTGEIATPNGITPDNPGIINIPNTLTPDTQGEIATPNTITPDNAGDISAPNAIPAQPAGDISPPADLTAQTAGEIATPNTLTPDNAGDIAPPNVISNRTAGEIAVPNVLAADPIADINTPNVIPAQSLNPVVIPNIITPDNAGDINPPTVLAPETAGEVAIPNNLSNAPAVPISTPNTLTPDAQGEISIPNTITPDNAGDIAPPNVIPAESIGSLSAPNTLTPAPASIIKRTILPLLAADFTSELFFRNKLPLLATDLFTYTRTTGASYVNRFPVDGGGYVYFVDYDFVGDVTNLQKSSENYTRSLWTKTNISSQQQTNQSPDEGIFASTLTEGIANGNHQLRQYAVGLFSGEIYNISTYVKYTSRQWVRIGDDSIGYVWFDILNGVTGQTSGAPLDYGIANHGNGWLRCWVNIEANNAWIYQVIALADVDGGEIYSGDGKSGCFIYGSQVTDGEVLKPYVKSTNIIRTESFPPSLRYEYDSVTGEALGVLIEQTTTNYAKRSQNFVSSTWGKQGLSIFTGYLAPNSTNSAMWLMETNNLGIHELFQPKFTAGVNGKNTRSFYVKAYQRSWCAIGQNDGVSNNFAWFDLANGVLGTVQGDLVARIQPLAQGWYRCSVAFDSTGTVERISLVCAESDGVNVYQGIVNYGILAWGAQYENGLHATSYIRTDAVYVERGMDVLETDTSGLFFNDQYSMRSEAQTHGTPNTLAGENMTIMALSDNTATSVNFIEHARTDQNKSNYASNAGLISQYSYNAPTALVESAFAEQVTTYNRQSINLYQNGVKLTTINDVIPLSNNSLLAIGGRRGGSMGLCGHVKKIELYRWELTPEEVLSLWNGN